ncbi:hypothetical protein FH972_022568 [Carpinus fangiana]|uniref:Uncharacterized protein n=1 Tax=Carpinus fangiana TaxID=176857 RepID=A0A5N6KUV8_9ROSI|nr:hypothetical protein FH972_022568 [Carpinus fangiana]
MASHTMRNLSNLDDIQASSLYARQGGLPMHSDQPPCQPQGGRRQRRSLKLFPYIPDNPITGSSSTKFHASMPLAAPAKPLKSESSYTSDSAKPRNGGLSFVPPPLRIKSRFYNAHSALPPAVSEVNGTATFVRNPADLPKQLDEPAHDTPAQQNGSQQFERQSKPRISLQHPRRSIPNLLDLIEERKRVAQEQAVSQSSARPVTPVTPARAMELESGGKVTAAEVIEVALHGTVWEAELRKVKAASWRDWEARVRDARERAAAREHSLWRRSSSIGLEGLKRAGREVRAAFRGS